METLAKYTYEELENYIISSGEQKFRAKQLYSWIYSKSARSFDDMSDIKKDFREKLKINAQILDTKIKAK